MRARLLRFFQDVTDAFWVLPALIVLVLAGLAVVAVDIQLLGHLPDWIPSGWVYGGGDTGARTLLGAIASSTIGVAGTLFSITIAALTLASSQMGPRLLRNFMRDRGNQLTLGVFLGTFGYSLIVLRSVRGGEDGAFVPALGVTLGLASGGRLRGPADLFHPPRRQPHQRRYGHRSGPRRCHRRHGAADPGRRLSGVRRRHRLGRGDGGLPAPFRLSAAGRHQRSGRLGVRTRTASSGC